MIEIYNNNLDYDNFTGFVLHIESNKDPGTWQYVAHSFYFAEIAAYALFLSVNRSQNGRTEIPLHLFSVTELSEGEIIDEKRLEEWVFDLMKFQDTDAYEIPRWLQLAFSVHEKSVLPKCEFKRRKDESDKKQTDFFQ